MLDLVIDLTLFWCGFIAVWHSVTSFTPQGLHIQFKIGCRKPAVKPSLRADGWLDPPAMIVDRDTHKGTPRSRNCLSGADGLLSKLTLVPGRYLSGHTRENDNFEAECERLEGL